MFTSNGQFGYPCPRGGGQAVQAGLLKFWAGGKINLPGQLGPHPCQYATQLNIWSKHLRLTEIKFISLSTKYSCSRWCNKICRLSILCEILGRGQDKPPWTACPPPLVNTQPNWTFEVSISVKFMSLSTKYSCRRCCNKICGLSILSVKFSAGGGKINHPGQLAPPPLVNMQPNWTFEVSISVKFMSLLTKYSCSRWCNKICGLSILSEILCGGQDKPPWTACPPPLVNT